MCDARIRPFPNPTELKCDLAANHRGAHSAVLRDYAYPGSSTVMEWYEGDRRSFRGTWQPCGPDCVLPAGHPGLHAA